MFLSSILVVFLFRLVGVELVNQAGSSQGNVSGTPLGGDAGNNGDADLTHGSGGEPTIGTQQNPPIPGNNDDADVHGPQGDKAALEFYKNALINAYERQYAANQQSFAISGGILIGLSVQQLKLHLQQSLLVVMVRISR